MGAWTLTPPLPVPVLAIICICHPPTADAWGPWHLGRPAKKASPWEDGGLGWAMLSSFLWRANSIAALSLGLGWFGDGEGARRWVVGEVLLLSICAVVCSLRVKGYFARYGGVSGPVDLMHNVSRKHEHWSITKRQQTT
ncbi:hypothetical protein GY45DRAFT_1062018 [Cubamyces sp. BRFM 1775]|nr:hypothetical protein GY45DRAFT_1062018 [Cubamyces sp. BRFM 1775]